MRRIALVCEKGGTGKTTTATALAVGLARRGLHTLLIDSDQQANSSWTLSGGQGANSPSLAAVLMRQSSAVEAIRPTSTPGLDLLPADLTLGGVNVALAQEFGRDTRLRSALAPLEGQYDYVLIDTGPAFNTIAANVLVYAAEVIVPLDPGMFAVLGLVQLETTIKEVREAYGTNLRLSGLVLTKCTRNNVSRDVENGLRARFGALVFKTTIPQSAKVEEAHSHGLTVLDHSPKSAAALAYGQLAEEIIHGREKRSRGATVRRSGTSAA
jgi:chromosome partitioning protein